ncbi:3-keto-disaccharide hydrolase [Planctomycetes bacterium K23_9]|uniref:3-keto-alpha-glucoside-1,2-lyase/3-keto-2-hydroxy-glucal hydratase domain-containing protein n=1 Tax=Stieleria marina TaxID=1930275 RepID=A0A517NMZ2_9BACT|nr:hypothetical protein K239x_04300 [Planctomycetes bacterium K23_9]
MLRYVLCTVILLASSAALRADEPAKSAETIFDGTTMKGWEGNKKWFRVQDGALVAGTLDKKIPVNEFLCTKKTYGDFELRLEAKLIGQGTNAGIQFRSKRIPQDTELIGYQADIGTTPDRSIWGALYDESRRRVFLAETPDVSKAATKEGWNEIRVLCKGPRIQIFINGEQTVDYTETDDSIPLSGIIGLQIHSGPPAEAWYRNIRITELSE